MTTNEDMCSIQPMFKFGRGKIRDGDKPMFIREDLMNTADLANSPQNCEN